ncbi:MAG: ABC transporter substrate-binding protein [Chloroflexi bacterium]|nr:ABC transporter substrate-binding protein [Chloroflexota bacterium]
MKKRATTPIRVLGPLTGVLALALTLQACGAAEPPTPPPTPTTAPAIIATPTTVATPSPAPRVVASPTPAPAATATPAGPQPKYGGIAVFAHRGDPTTWDLLLDTNRNLTLLLAPIAGPGTLVTRCRENNFEICPYLAESWEPNPTFTEWTFRVRQGVVWHDGTPLTAEDIKWWLDLTVKGLSGRKPSKDAAKFGPIEKVEVVDRDKVRIVLSEPRVEYPAPLTERWAYLAYPRHLMKPQMDKGNVSVAPNEVGWVSAGPFKVARYDKGSVFQVRRFDRYWEKDEKGRQLPFLDGIDYPIISESSTVLAAFRTGRVDRTGLGSGHFLVRPQMDTLKRELGDKVWFANYPPTGQLMGINARKAPYNDVRVRQAISLWLDRQDYIDAIQDGDGDLVAVWLPTSPYTNPDFREWPGWNPRTKAQDRKRAQELLAQAGYPNGFKVTILTGQAWINYGEWAQAQLAGLLGQGNVRIEIVDSTTFFDRLCRSAFELVNPLSSGVEARYSAETVAGGYVSTNRCSYIQHDDKKVDQLFAQIASSFVKEERTRLMRDVERYLSTESWLALNIAVEKSWAAYRGYVKGWAMPLTHVTGNADYATTWLDK